MALKSVELIEERVRLAHLKRLGERILVKGVATEEIKNLGGGEIYLSIFYPNPVMEEVEIPPVDDEETREILIKKALRDMGLQSDVLFIYKKLSQENRYSVHAIPAEIYSRILGAVNQEDIKLLTTSEFSLAGVSKAIEPDKTVFHLFADEERVILSVSRGDEVIYTRVQTVPEYVREREGGLVEFIRENFSMTYSFVHQRQRTDIDIIFLSGLAREVDIEFYEIPTACPLPGDRFLGVEVSEFHSFLPCFGMILISEHYDFSPASVKELKRFEATVGKVSKVLTLLSLILVLLLTGFAYNLYGKLREIETTKDKLLTDMNHTLLRYFRDEAELKYYSRYIREVENAVRSNPLNLISRARVLEELMGDAVAVRVYGEGVSRGIEILVKKTFKDISRMGVFMKELRDSLKELEASGITYDILNERRDNLRKEMSFTLRIREVAPP